MDGFLVSKTDGGSVTQYNYSTRGELLSVTLPDSNQIEYLHDPLGRRVAKKVNGTMKRYGKSEHFEKHVIRTIFKECPTKKRETFSRG